MNISMYNYSGNKPVWETQQVNYFQDPIVNSVFRPFGEEEYSDAIVFYYEDEAKEYLYWGYGDRTWGWLITEQSDGMGSDAITLTEQIADEVAKNVPHQVFRSGSCPYGN